MTWGSPQKEKLSLSLKTWTSFLITYARGFAMCQCHACKKGPIEEKMQALALAYAWLQHWMLFSKHACTTPSCLSNYNLSQRHYKVFKYFLVLHNSLATQPR
jgi:hypothetical protein